MTQKWLEKMTKTRYEMTALGLPGGRKKDGAKVVEDTISAQDRWTTSHDLIFRLPDMPDNLAYSTWYREGSTERQDEVPWEYEDAECVLVRKVSKVIETWAAEPVPEPEPRIEVRRMDPDTLVGIAPCDDGSEGWVVMAVQPDPDGPGEVIAPVGDEIGEIVYQDILDAAEVLRTGIVWKHDMGEGEPDDGPTPVRLDKTISPIGKDSAFEVRIMNGAKFTPRLSWFTDAARVFDERTGKMLKDRNPEAPPCQVVVQYGPERNEFFVKRNSAEVDFNFGPLNRMINGMMDRLVKSSLNAGEAPDVDEDQP